MCHVNSNDNTACAQHPPRACRRSIISPRLWQDPRFAGTRIPACLPQPQIMKARLGCEIAHLRFLLIFPFQRKNERSWGRGRDRVWGQTAAFSGCSLCLRHTAAAWTRAVCMEKLCGHSFRHPVPEPEESQQPGTRHAQKSESGPFGERQSIELEKRSQILKADPPNPRVTWNRLFNLSDAFPVAVKREDSI